VRVLYLFFFDLIAKKRNKAKYKIHEKKERRERKIVRKTDTHTHVWICV